MSVIIVGSSGGGMATLGHADPIQLITTIHKELGRIPSTNHSTSTSTNSTHNHGVKFALFVSCAATMDSVDPDKEIATLWTVGFDRSAAEKSQNTNVDANTSSVFQIKPYYTGLLKDVNLKAKELETKFLVPAILGKSASSNANENATKIQGMICISCDPGVVNRSSLAAAAEVNLPVTGSGGTSLSVAASIHRGLNLVGNTGGSVATTTYTRAVSYCHSLATSWGGEETYSPFAESTNGRDNEKTSMGSILDACLPSFLAVCVTCRILDMLEETSFLVTTLGALGFGAEDQIRLKTQLQFQALPSVCAVVAATSLAPEHGSTAVMAAAIASMGCWGSVLSGLLVGWVVSFLLGRVLFLCIRLKVPATMTNILVAGFVGSTIALLCSCFGISQLSGSLTNCIRTLVRTPPSFLGPLGQAGYGFLFGCIFCYGSKVGWYHSIFLPVILLEMERGEMSVWGAVDECTLVLVSAGICAASVLTKGDALPKRGLIINLSCGDFIEVAYPYMSRSWVVNLAAYCGCGISTAILYGGGDPSAVMSSAYFPLPLALFLAEDRARLGMAMLSAFSIPFIGMLLKNVLLKEADAQESRSDKKDE